MTLSTSSPQCRQCGESLPAGGRHAGGRPRLYCSEACKRGAERQRRYGDGEATFDSTYIGKIIQLGDRVIADMHQLAETIRDPESTEQTLSVSPRIVKSADLIDKAVVMHMRANGVTWREIGACLSANEDATRRKYDSAPEMIERALQGTEAEAARAHGPFALQSATPGPGSAVELTVADLIRDLLFHSGMSMTQLAKRAQVSVSYVSRILNEGRTPSAKVLGALLKVLLSDSESETPEPAALHALRHVKGQDPSLTPAEIAEFLAILHTAARPHDATSALRTLVRGGTSAFLASLAVELRARDLGGECNTLLRSLAIDHHLRIVEVIKILRNSDEDQLLHLLYVQLARHFSLDTLSTIDDLVLEGLTPDCGSLAEAIGAYGAPEAITLLVRWLRTRADPLELIDRVLLMVMKRRAFPVLVQLMHVLEQENETDIALKLRSQLTNSIYDGPSVITAQSGLPSIGSIGR